MKQLTFVSLVLLLLVGCRKDTLQDRLEGDAANFVGKWEWTHSVQEFVHSDSPPEFVTHTPETTGNTYQLEFLEEGIAILSKNDEVQGRYSMDFNGAKTDSVKVSMSGRLYRNVGEEKVNFGVFYNLSSPDDIQFWYYPLELYVVDGNHYKRIQ